MAKNQIRLAVVEGVQIGAKFTRRAGQGALTNRLKIPRNFCLAAYLEAFIVAPSSRLSWENLTRWAEKNGGWSPTPIAPPGGKPFGDVSFDETLLKAEDGTVNWLRYRQMREAWQKQIFKKEFPNADKYRQTLREEAAALRIVAETSKTDLQKGKVKKLDDGLANLIKINDAGLLEAYVLFARPNDEIFEDYDQYRITNRDKLRRFIIEFLIGA